MSDEEKLNKAVEQAVEVAANKAAEDEIDQLTKFENAIDETLASGYLDDTLTVTDEQGGPSAAGLGFRTGLAPGGRP